MSECICACVCVCRHMVIYFKCKQLFQEKINAGKKDQQEIENWSKLWILEASVCI